MPAPIEALHLVAQSEHALAVFEPKIEAHAWLVPGDVQGFVGDDLAVDVHQPQPQRLLVDAQDRPLRAQHDQRVRFFYLRGDTAAQRLRFDGEGWQAWGSLLSREVEPKRVGARCGDLNRSRRRLELETVAGRAALQHLAFDAWRANGHWQRIWEMGLPQATANHEWEQECEAARGLNHRRLHSRAGVGLEAPSIFARSCWPGVGP